MFCSLMCSWHLEKCLAHSRCSVNICGVDKWVGGWKRSWMGRWNSG